MPDRIRSDVGRTTLICVDSYENGVLQGCYYNYSRPDDAIAFHSLTQLLVGMEQLLDSANYPRSFTAHRSFMELTELKTEETLNGKARKGALGTFIVKVLFRQHTSWQGTVTWQEAKCDQSFRSVLELILLMDSALSGKETE